MGSASTEISRGRKLAASAGLLAAGGLVAREAVSSNFHIEWLLLAFAGVLAMASVGITRRSLIAQVLSRGAAWIVLTPALFLTFFEMLHHGQMPNIEVAGLAAGTGAALLLARPMLHTKEAREAFAPKAFRSWFLAGSTATAATAFVMGGTALDTLLHWPLVGAALAGLTTALLASAIGVVRMRGWGILLAGLTSLVMMVSAVFLSRGESMALMLAATPSLLLHVMPVLLARWGLGRSSKVRVDDLASDLDAAPAYTNARYRIAADESDDLDPETPAAHRRAAVRV